MSPPHNEANHIPSTAEIRCDIERVIVPDPRTAARWPDSDPDSIDIELISRIRREM